MATVKVEKNSYTVEPLYQWDKDQTLEIYGLSLASIPEVHFANAAMSRAIVRQTSMDAAGVVRVEVPNSMLQKPYTIQVYVCTYAGSTFETQYKLELPVKARTQPADYTLEDDPEVYSFNALENQVVNALNRLDKETTAATKALTEATAAQKEAKTAYENAKSDVDGAVDAAVDTAMEGIMPTLLSDDTKAAYGLGVDAVPNDVLALIPSLIAGRAQVATGSYTGTGTYGKRNPNSLTFDFVPKFVAFSSTIYTAFGYLLNPGTSAYLCGNATEGDQTVTWNNTTVSWYSDDAHAQLNYTNTEYYYIAIG